MTLEEIDEYKQCVGKGERGGIQLFGYTSCSLKKDEALKFAWENQHTGHQKVLFHIKWTDRDMHYFLNSGAYDQEEEVLLYDGVNLKVNSVLEATDGKGSL